MAFYPDAVLDLLASPILMAIARDICGPDAVPLQCDALFKHNHLESEISWHQDALHARKFPYLNVGIYLDDAPLGDGCLQYITKSQHKKQDIGKLVSQYGWDLPDMVKVPVKAGDILIQDMMVLHGSQMKRDPGVRRTIYVEMRPATAVLDQGAQSREWMALRKRWMGIVLRRSKSKWPEDSYTALTKDLKSDSEEIEKILRLREPPIPANYGL
ncbi:phytanoyl-CoA dioxygenase family protein [Lacinutrix neustonica]|uniref:Phytanoyl-CoA dioxygenase family protein n=1 Tax=Lacinutrix neustonica TaxID=2980107 RepID=A0A9E8MV89_9FLAO|nr:phytanoyl-CoA dioxygenase family protein [Lacinutrix neustonica]WAC02123.1 phytanoyl-CoA dioxygenase family protein [Lacinutrix neustonica]